MADQAKTALQAQLMALQDGAYREFQCRLMPTVERESVIGIRTPQLRTFAKRIEQSEVAPFLTALPHRFYEENNLHGLLIAQIRDFDEAIAAINAFLPYIDNWATCDLVWSKAFQKNLPALYEQIQRWTASGQTYTIRFGVGALMRCFLDEHFFPESLAHVAALRSEEYYVNMMFAWYFATALAKQYDATLPYLQQHLLARWTHNKAIQKAIESNRINGQTKAYLRTLKY